MFASDAFNEDAGVLLSAHTAPLGGAWTLQSGFADKSRLTANGANRLRPEQTGSAAWYWSASMPPSSDYEVSVDIVRLDTLKDSLSQYIWVLARGVNVANMDCYAAFWYSFDKRVDLYRYSAGVGVALTPGGAGAVTPTIGIGTTRLALRVVGSKISVYFNGALLYSVTDTAVTGAGLVGCGTYFQGAGSPSDTSGNFADNFRADAVVIPSTPVFGQAAMRAAVI